MIGGGWALPPTDANLNRISQEYSHEDIAAATNGFGESSQLGRGTYGSVYRGMLRDGTEVAVKALARPHEAGFREEVEVLSRFRHPNLVILMGFARKDKQRYLVYELLPGGDVCMRLQRDHSFTWQPRLTVLLDAALGLSHLHGSQPQVFHRDIKTQNILMDRNGTGKMADFGLALLAQPNCDSMQVKQTSGTIGYADPLYIRTGQVTERSEVYSYGMVLLEVLTRRPPALQHTSGRIEYQFEHIKGDPVRVRAMLDPRAGWPSSLADRLGSLALRCAQDNEAQRPVFVEIVGLLRQLTREASAPAATAGLGAAAPAATPLSPLNGRGAGPGAAAPGPDAPLSPNAGKGHGHLLEGALRPQQDGGAPHEAIQGMPAHAPRRRSTPFEAPSPGAGGSGGMAGVVERSERPLAPAVAAHGGVAVPWPSSGATAGGAAANAAGRARAALDGGGAGYPAYSPASARRRPWTPDEAMAEGAGMVDASPPEVIDCGPGVAYLGGSGGRAGAASSRESVERQPLREESRDSDLWIDPRPQLDAAGAAIVEGIGNMWSAVAGNSEPKGQLPDTELISRQREADIRRLQEELGFTRMQVVEAFKRCSSCEAAVDWILSPEREWNM